MSCSSSPYQITKTTRRIPPAVVAQISQHPSLTDHPSLHDNARDRDAATLVAVALDALGLARQTTGGLGRLEDALDGGDGRGCGTVGHFDCLALLSFLSCSLFVFLWGGGGAFRGIDLLDQVRLIGVMVFYSCSTCKARVHQALRVCLSKPDLHSYLGIRGFLEEIGCNVDDAYNVERDLIVEGKEASLRFRIQR